MSRLSPERLAVGRVLARFYKRTGRLDRWLSQQSANLTSDQRRRARAVLYAALRNQHLIGVYLSPFLRRALRDQQPAPRAALTLAVAEMKFLDATPDRAAVDQAVELCRALGGTGQAGFVNAVLRKVATAPDPELPDRGEDPLLWAGVVCSHPRWIVEQMAALVGPEGAAAWCEANQQEPTTALAVPAASDRAELIEQVGAEPGRLAPWAVRLPRGSGAIGALPGFSEGRFWVQDEAAQLAAEMVGALPGQRILDACAAPGGKTMYLATRVGPEGYVLATDSDARRLRQVNEASGRIGTEHVATAVRDWVQEPFGAREDDRPFDAVLLDAPCSGLGVIRRHPDVRLARRRSDLARYAERQLALLRALAPAVRPGGRLVYAVCTFTAEETEEVLTAARSEGSLDDFDREVAQQLLPDLPEGPMVSGALRTLSSRDGSDVFFAVALRRRT